MPLYEYECNVCRQRFEKRQKVTDEPESICPSCGGPVRRVIFPVGIIFKGSGFYVTDNRKGDSVTSSTADKSASDKESSAKTDSESKKSDSSATAKAAESSTKNDSGSKASESSKSSDGSSSSGSAAAASPTT